jgi:copper chaperone CopZ
MKTFNSRMGLIPLTLLLIVFSFLKTEANAIQIEKKDNSAYIKIWVDGMACPFCAYGLEKKIKKIEGAGDLFIEINEGFISFSVPINKVPTTETLQKIVKEAGFFARKIEFSKEAFKHEINE